MKLLNTAPDRHRTYHEVENMNVPVKKAGDDGRRHYKALLLDFGSVIQKSFFETRRALERLLNNSRRLIEMGGTF